jgi:hypothetical protein
MVPIETPEMGHSDGTTGSEPKNIRFFERYLFGISPLGRSPLGRSPVLITQHGLISRWRVNN